MPLGKLIIWSSLPLAGIHSVVLLIIGVPGNAVLCLTFLLFSPSDVHLIQGVLFLLHNVQYTIYSNIFLLRYQYIIEIY